MSGYSGIRITGGGDGASEAGNYGPVFKPGLGPPTNQHISRGGYILGGTGSPGPYAAGGNGPYSSAAGMVTNDPGQFCWTTIKNNARGIDPR